MLARVFTVIYFGFFLLMPIYTRWEKTKPVPKSVTHEPDAEEKYAKLVEAFDKMTIKEEEPTDKTSWGGPSFAIKPNKSGIIEVTTGLLKKLKESLD
jgi:ubiquinol-cytochrome c reductase cytochrome b subunit